MSPSEHSPPPRPLKRARKLNPDPEPPKEQYLASAPLDHIFIADGIHTKKSGKKVSLDSVFILNWFHDECLLQTPLSCCECRR